MVGDVGFKYPLLSYVPACQSGGESTTEDAIEIMRQSFVVPTYPCLSLPIIPVNGHLK